MFKHAWMDAMKIGELMERDTVLAVVSFVFWMMRRIIYFYFIDYFEKYSVLFQLVHALMYMAML